MILKYGSYTHALAEAGIAITRESVRSSSNAPYLLKERWDIEGYLLAADAAALTVAIKAMVAAYAKDHQDLILFQPDGSTPTAHSMRVADSVGGVFVVRKPSFPEWRGGEGGTFRKYTLAVEANFPDPNADNELLEYDETITIQGTGGPLWKYQPVLEGPPIRQQLQQITSVICTQAGRSVAAFYKPSAAPPLYPSAEHGERRSITSKSPKRIGKSAAQYETAWSYTFEYLR